MATYISSEESDRSSPILGDFYVEYKELDDSADEELVDQLASNVTQQNLGLGAEPYMFEPEAKPDEHTLAAVSCTDNSVVSQDSASPMDVDPRSVRLGNREWYSII